MLVKSALSDICILLLTFCVHHVYEFFPQDVEIPTDSLFHNNMRWNSRQHCLTHVYIDGY